MISGIDAFKLYDTYGYPIELTEECASERGFIVDNDGFKKYMEIQKETARRNRKIDSSMNIQNELLLNYKDSSKFVGYDTLEVKTINLLKSVIPSAISLSMKTLSTLKAVDKYATKEH